MEPFLFGKVKCMVECAQHRLGIYKLLILVPGLLLTLGKSFNLLFLISLEYNGSSKMPLLTGMLR